MAQRWQALTIATPSPPLQYVPRTTTCPPVCRPPFHLPSSLLTSFPPAPGLDTLPCPALAACLQRFERPPLQRLAKTLGSRAARIYQDERFSYLVVAR